MNHNRAHAVPLHLVDGPPINRADHIALMAQDLVRFDSFRNEKDAILSLHGAGHSMVYAVMWIHDIRQAAFQIVVAREMAGS